MIARIMRMVRGFQSQWIRPRINTHVTNTNTKFYGKNITNVNPRNIPREKRVYLQSDVTPGGKIRHVYHSDGLLRWLQRNPTSPFTRRPVAHGGVRRLH
jgi:hypothetical protein